MARDKERSVNPAQQQRKLEKAKQLKKSRAELQARRNEKLARRNPERIQRQIDDLKALEAAGDIKPRERAILEDLERDLRAVRKAREALGDKAPNFAGQPRRREGEGSGTTLGKRRHDGERKYQHSKQESSGSDTDESVRRIPMPEDTPPPIPREFRRHFPRREDGDNSQQATATATAPGRPSLPTKPGTKPIEVKTTYESAPQIRDLRKEAVNRFVPDVVRKKQEAAKGGPTGRLIEPEEMDRLEAEGYLGNKANDDRTTETATTAGGDVDVDDEKARRLAEEEERFLREVEMQDQKDADEERRPKETVESRPIPRRNVEIEEIEDEDA